MLNLFKKNERNTSGVLEWNTVEEACDALIFCNHTVIPSPGDRVPFVLRLAFSSSGTGSTVDRRFSRNAGGSNNASGGGSSTSNGWHPSGNSSSGATGIDKGNDK